MDDCFNAACDDYDPCFEGNCRWRNKASTKLCWGFIPIESSSGFGKYSDSEYGCTPEREGINMKNDDVKKGPPPNNTGGSRMNARSVLQNKIRRCEKELDALKTLGESIEWGILNPQEEELLWHYFSTH